MELLADEVHDRVGVRPDDRAVKTFLRELTGSLPTSPTPPTPPSPTGRATVEVRGERRDFTFVKDALVFLLTELSKTDGTFLERCSRDPVFARGKKARQLARSPEELFPTRPDRRKYHARLPGGWFLNTNTNTSKKEQEARAAAEVAGLKFGTDVIVDFRSP